MIGYWSEIKSETLGSTYEMFLTWNQWSHVWKMCQGHHTCAWNVSSGNMPGKLFLSLQCSQHVSTCFQALLPPVIGVDHSSDVSDIWPNTLYEMLCDQRQEAYTQTVSGLTYFHLLIKFFSLLFPCFNDTCLQMCLSGNILVSDAALTKVYQELVKWGCLTTLID